MAGNWGARKYQTILLQLHWREIYQRSKLWCINDKNINFFWFLRTETLRKVKASFTYRTDFVPSQNHSGSVFPFTFETVFTTNTFVPFLHLFTMQNKRYTYIGKIITSSQPRSLVGGGGGWGGGGGGEKVRLERTKCELMKKSRDDLFKRKAVAICFFF